MKYKLFALLFISLLADNSFAQKKPYFTNGGDLIFSYGLATDSAGNDLTSNVRFSSWYHIEETLNIDFSKSAGFITGLGLENIGMITKPNEAITVKQRAYSLGLPIGFRFGNLEKRRFITIGGEGELMLDYKEKVFDGKNKMQKHHEWLSNNTNLLNPSVFLKYQKKSVYVCAKYYLMDFLKPSDIHIDKTSFIPAYPKTSQLFYISIGYSSKGKSKGKKINQPEPKKVNLI
ncbi:MAG: hypothetical protein D4R43_01940 [Sphingobacteriales bacterium]|nr:MAG: hypothetical protein D4R43_01940 [Sphingobacteriales bacterium]